ncbi:endonuclease domain-containing protein [Botryobacter ruber]|uniref:endonuclease domain-containing protein n=1 Tax=Botryobacter ruber TaxID=2171629 RepID=UPI000E0CA5B0|nr:endonuclease domain-containing protein [Botryobacter ruber]
MSTGRKNTIIPYRKDLKEKARELRKNSTLSEILLWQEIRDRKMHGYQFHRQVPMLNFIVDFYCHELKLAIEVDGNSHQHKVSYDDKRQQELEQYEVCFLRFDDLEVKRDIRNVLRTIEYWILEKQEKGSQD